MRLVINPINKNYSSATLSLPLKTKARFDTSPERHQLAKMVGLSQITGNLSSVDSGHFDKLCYIYEKFGFEVNIRSNQGTIKKRKVL